MSRFLALLLVALMATTVVSTAGVLAAPKAAACTPTAPPIGTPTVWYKPGKTTLFVPWQYNIHDASYTAFNPSQHNEWAKWMTAYASTAGSCCYAGSEAGVGVRWQLKGITANQLAGKTATITMLVSYKLTAKASTQWMDASLETLVGCKDNSISTSQNYALNDIAQSTAAGVVIIQTKTFTHTFPLSDVCYYDAPTHSIYGSAVSYVIAETNSVTTGQATAITNAYTIAVTFS